MILFVWVYVWAPIRKFDDNFYVRLSSGCMVSEAFYIILRVSKIAVGRKKNQKKSIIFWAQMTQKNYNELFCSRIRACTVNRKVSPEADIN